MHIAFSPPDITDLEIQEVIEALKSGWITTGPKTKQFEKELAAVSGNSRAIALNSATAAMELLLRLMGIGPGDEVITSAYTYTASASVIDHVGAQIVLVDTAPGSFFIDTKKLEAAITEKTKAIIPVDLGGVMADYDKIFQAVENQKHLFRPRTALQEAFGRVIVLGDAAHSVGASYQGKKSGSAADFTAFSFHAVKNLTTAEGGGLTWKDRPFLNNDEIYQQLQLLSLHGQNKDALSKMKLGAWEYDIACLGYKCNMTDIAAGLGLAQLKRFEELKQKRLQFIEAYDAAFKPMGVLSLSHFTPGFEGNGHLYLARIPGIGEKERNEIISVMAENGIACNVHFKPLPLFTAYQALNFDISDYPNAYAQYQNEITLPSHTLIGKEERDYIIAQFQAAISPYLK